MNAGYDAASEKPTADIFSCFSCFSWTVVIIGSLTLRILSGKYSSAYATSVNICINDSVFIHLFLTHVFCQGFY